MSTATEKVEPATPVTAPVVDPIAGGAALARHCRADEPYVLYERDGEVGFAAGAAAELVLTADGLRVTGEDGRTRTEPLGSRPLDQVAAAMPALLPPGRRAYGWASFELSHVLYGLSLPPGTGDLLRMVLPTDEVRMSAAGRELRHVGDPGRAQDWERVLAAAVPASGGRRLDIDESVGADRYREMVAAAVDDIAAARFRKAILSRSVPVNGDIDLVASYTEGRRQNTPARSFLLRLGGLAAAGFSPETVIEVAPDGSLSTQPLAGTRARHGDAAIDATLQDELLTDPKEVYEHAVSVQIAQDEVTAVSVPGSVSVAEFMRVVERGSVHHLGSRVRGRLRPGATCWDAFARLFPAVTASGLPKVGACEAIARHENGPRGLYSGSVLTVDSDGGMDAALVLRTIYQQDGRTWLRAGAGIVGQSTPDRELEETCEKLRSVSRFLISAERGTR